MSAKNRWLALIILCLGDLMIVLDTTIVNVALPSIKNSLGFLDSQLVWVVNAYMLTFGGFLLLGGRLGDLFGHKRLFTLGIGMFTIASVLCGLSMDQTMLIVARALQGIGGAVVSAVALSLIMLLFESKEERTKAMGVFGFVAAGGGAVGVFLGGILTQLLSWQWIFLVNIPIGIAVIILSAFFIPKDVLKDKNPSLDIAGSVLITSGLMVLVYAIVNGNGVGWMSTQTLSCMGVAAAAIAAFLVVELKAKHPLIPMSLFKIRNVSVSNGVAVLWAIAMFAWFFISALYMQNVLKYSPLEVGLAFLPANIIMAVFSLGLSAKCVFKLGIRKSLSFGLFLAAFGLFLFSQAPINGSFVLYVLPCMCLIGLGGGMAFNPMLLAAMNDVSQEEAGIASGIINTSFMMGGAVGLAILASISAYITQCFTATGMSLIGALNNGYHVAFLCGAVVALAASALALTLKTST
jgi:EmrB/QacA subfamily drug resistance transporter